MHSSLKFILTVFFVLSTSAFTTALAAQVAGVKGKQVLIRGNNLKNNGLYYVVVQGKRQGIVRIKKVQGNKGLGLLLKGRAAKGANLVQRSAKPSSVAKGKPSSPSRKSTTPRRSTAPSQHNPPSEGFYGLGGAIAYQQNKSSIKFNSGDSDSLSGSGISFKAFGDYMFTEKIHLRGEVGTLAFKSEGADKCFGEICRMNISYLGATIGARYIFNSINSRVRYWGGAAGSLIFPLSTGNTNAVQVEDVSSTMLFHVGGGLDYDLNDKYYIPVTVEYVMFPPSDDVSSSMIQLKVGFAMKF